MKRSHGHFPQGRRRCGPIQQSDSRFSLLTPRSAFTLVELLVVIAIIAILASLLLPSLKSARDMAKTAKCVSNQKQIVIAATLYASEHNGQLPNGDDYTEPRDASWVGCIKPYLQLGAKGSASNIRDLACPSAVLSNPSQNLSTGVLYWNVFGHEAAVPAETRASPQLSELAATTVLTGDNDTNTGLIMSPQVYPFYVDSDGDGVKDDYNGYNIYGNLVFRHQKQAVCGFADGSVRKVRLSEWLDPRNKDNSQNGMWGPKWSP